MKLNTLGSRFFALVLVFCMAFWSFFMPIAQAVGVSPRRIADNIYAVQDFDMVVYLSKSSCITGVESVRPGSSSLPFWVWVVPKNHSACKNIPQVVEIPEISEHSGIRYYGGGILEVTDLEASIPILDQHFVILDTETFTRSGSTAYLVLIRNRTT
jgi:hypothetical protein